MGPDKIADDITLTTNATAVERVMCQCCGMSEDCTPTYIGHVKEFFCGRWVCGLCTEAVKEQTRRAPGSTMKEAMEAHTILCKQFNMTTRVNPKLSLANAMRDIVRKSNQHRAERQDFHSQHRKNLSGPRTDVAIKRLPSQ